MEHKTGYNRVAKNMVLYFVSKGVETVSGIVVLALITRHLGGQSYGRFAFTMNLILVFIPVVNFGLSSIIIRDIARDKAHASEHFGRAVACRTLLVLFSVGAVLMIASQLSGISMIAVALAMISEFSLAYMRLCSDLYIGLERMEYDALLTVINRLMNLVGIGLAVIYDKGLMGIFVCMATVNFCTAILGFGIVRRKFIIPNITFKLASIKSLLREAFPIALSAFLNEMLVRLDVFILKILKDFTEIAMFDAPLRLILRLASFSLAFVTSLVPIYSRLARFSRRDLLYLYERSMKVLFAFILPVAIFATLFGGRISVLLFGNQFINSGASLQLLVCVLFIIFIDILTAHILISLNRQNVIAVQCVICFFINLILEIILIPRYGHTGASISKVIAFGMTFFIPFYFVTRELGVISISNVVIKPLLSGIVMGGVVYLLGHCSLAVLMIIGGVVYGGGLYGLRLFTDEEVVRLKEILKST